MRKEEIINEPDDSVNSFSNRKLSPPSIIHKMKEYNHSIKAVQSNDKQIEFYNLLGKPIKYINLDIADEPKRIVTDAKNKIYLFCETDLVIFDQFN